MQKLLVDRLNHGYDISRKLNYKKRLRLKIKKINGGGI